VALQVSRICRPLPLLGASKIRPERASESVRRTWSIPVPRSTSSQRSPSSSPRRSPEEMYGWDSVLYDLPKLLISG